MTPCIRYPDDDAVMRYVTGGVAEPELSAFEDHLFACDACLARVERFQAAQHVLGGHDLPALPTIVASGGHEPGGARRLSWWGMSGMAAALVAALSVVVLMTRPDAPAERVASGPAVAGAPAPPATLPETPTAGAAALSLQVAVLAMVTPPPYLPMVTRGATDEPERFATGMAAYARADWPAASRLLRDLDTPQATFYRGIADLMRGDTSAAIAALETARAGARQPYARESLFYLGKAALQRGEVGTARTWFTAARDASAGPDGESARLLAELDDLPLESNVERRTSNVERRTSNVKSRKP